MADTLLWPPLLALESPSAGIDVKWSRLSPTARWGDKWNPTTPDCAAVVRAAPGKLDFAAFVYMQSGSVTPPLAALYQGPYAVVSRHEKYICIQMGEQTESVSLDRLKPHWGSLPLPPATSPTIGACERLASSQLRPPLLSPQPPVRKSKRSSPTLYLELRVSLVSAGVGTVLSCIEF